ncbi:RNA polymerase sigma-54 factor [Fundidesulfovibrio magnetotacticus]|uniref:RNA polymerase sigma-54 factor n=1 Tax=Fundidesulfovibrio magnetotacticus TaxID=2730080 RepID=A0A6V8LY16_9BACT|nr:RNA polymerase factor sigma-54 [Fundidesulfovibrio magnetotacticus]GFK95138.1 RNA polymerase sigma-54 factor [Fundidesulfovibrio magnetotacticus]
MALELRQQLKLSQQLVMTPQLQQAIKLLQLSRLELVETVQQELMENPLLEETQFDDERPEPTIAEDSHAPDPTQEEGAMQRELMKTAEWDDYLGDFASTSRQATVREHETPEEGMSFEARLTAKPSLEGHLAWQISLSPLDARQQAIADEIVGNLDSGGYLRSSAEELAQVLAVTPEEVEVVIQVLQRLDPVGVAARSPQECLLVQLEVYGYTDPVLLEIVRDHLEDLEKKRYKPLAKKFRLSMEEVKEYLEIIQTLDPMPGSHFSSPDPVYVSPDAFVYKYGDDFVIVLNEDGLPKLQLSPYYMEDMGRSSANKEKEYLQDKMRSAQWLMKSLYQRQRTLFKVLESIVKFQREFFEDGVTRLRPLILKDVADDIGMHESTVSRITTSKYVATPHGIYELKFFFNSALELDDGSSVGSESVKAVIKQLISAEDPKKPTSDEQIAEILKQRLQVNIARRTVAKYRMAMGIESSSKRKDVL